MSEAVAAVPYERQNDPLSNRDCGAACLSMIYRSFGKEVPQSEIWQSIAKPNRFGSVASTTHLMAKDALSRGLVAVAFQTRDPLHALRLCCETGTRAILNHRPALEARTGHYSVLVGLDERDVVLHDPFYGPSMHVPHLQLVELWQPRFPNSEIIGNLLIAIADAPSAATTCFLCRTPVQSTVACPRCQEPVCLQPSAVLGCTNGDCVARVWNYICCPSCDLAFTVGSAASVPVQATSTTPAEAGTTPAAASRKDPLDLSHVLNEIDKFCALALTIPGAAAHPQVKKHLDFLASSKERLKMAAAESVVFRKTHEAQLATMMQTAKQNAEAHRQKREELNRQSPPLDANALGRALLKNLGLG